MVAEGLSLIHLTPGVRDRLQRFHPLLEGGGERTDRPVTPEEDAVPAEACDYMFDIRPQIFRPPSLGICRCYEAGDFCNKHSETRPSPRGERARERASLP